MEEETLLTENQAHVMYALDTHIKSLDNDELKEFYSNVEELLESLDCLSDQELMVLLEEKNRIIENLKKQEEAREFYSQAEGLLEHHLGKSMEVKGLEVDKPVELEF